MSTSFQRMQTSTIGTATGYAWSNSANWTNGIPSDGDDVVIYTPPYTTSPSSYDDISSLQLNSLNLSGGYLAVTGALQVGTLALSGNAVIASDTFYGSSSATLIVNDLTSSGYVAAIGNNAMTYVNGGLSVPESFDADNGGEVVISGAPSSLSGFYYTDAKDNSTFAFTNPGSIVDSAFHGLGVGESIAVPGNDVLSVTFTSNSMTIVTNLGSVSFTNIMSFTTVGVIPTGYTVSTDPTGLIRITIACFLEGTLIATPEGPVPVEHLRVGGDVLTVSGRTAPIRWIGRREVNCRDNEQPRDVWPIRIEAHTFGNDQPIRDLYLSPEHAVFTHGVLVPIRELINGSTISQVAMDHAIYHHIELDRHDVVLAEELPTESYLRSDSDVPFDLLPILPGRDLRSEATLCTAEPYAAFVRQGPLMEIIRSTTDLNGRRQEWISAIA